MPEARGSASDVSRNNIQLRMKQLKTVLGLVAGLSAMALQSCGNDEKSVNVERLSVAVSSVSLNVGDTYSPEVTVYPEDATDRTFTLTSNDESVASVSGGAVSAVAPGGAEITVADASGSVTTSFSVTVYPQGYPTEATVMTTATGFWYGDYYMAGTDNAWAYMTCGDVIFSEGAFSGNGIAAFLELNAPKTGEKSLAKGTYNIDPDGKMAEFTFSKGEDFNADGLQGTFVYDSSVEGNYLVVKDGWVRISEASGAYVVTACLDAGVKTYTFSYTGSFPLKDYSKDYDSYKVTEMKDLAVGTLDYYGTKIYGSTDAAPHSEWTIYLGNSSFDFDTYDGAGDMLMLDIITAAEYTTEVPSGRYTVMSSTDNAHFQPFSVVPGIGDASTGNVLGTWYAPDYVPTYAAYVGYADIVNKGNGTYSVDFKFRDDTNEAWFQGKFEGALKYGDYHE